MYSFFRFFSLYDGETRDKLLEAYSDNVSVSLCVCVFTPLSFLSSFLLHSPPLFPFLLRPYFLCLWTFLKTKGTVKTLLACLINYCL